MNVPGTWEATIGKTETVERMLIKKLIATMPPQAQRGLVAVSNSDFNGRVSVYDIYTRSMITIFGLRLIIVSSRCPAGISEGRT